MGTSVVFMSSNDGRELCWVFDCVDLVVSSVESPFSQRNRASSKGFVSVGHVDVEKTILVLRAVIQEVFLKEHCDEEEIDEDEKLVAFVNDVPLLILLFLEVSLGSSLEYTDGGEIPILVFTKTSVFGGSTEYRKDNDTAKRVLGNCLKIAENLFGNFSWGKTSLSPKEVNHRRCGLGYIVLVFDERSERPLSYDLFAMAQEGLSNLVECEKIGRWLVRQLMTLAGKDDIGFVITERFANGLSFDGLYLENKRKEVFGLLALQEQNVMESQVSRLGMWLLKVLWTFGVMAMDLRLRFVLNLAEYVKLGYSRIGSVIDQFGIKLGFPAGAVGAAGIYAKAEGVFHALVPDDYEVVVMLLQPKAKQFTDGNCGIWVVVGNTLRVWALLALGSFQSNGKGIHWELVLAGMDLGTSGKKRIFKVECVGNRGGFLLRNLTDQHRCLRIWCHEGMVCLLLGKPMKKLMPRLLGCEPEGSTYFISYLA